MGGEYKYIRRLENGEWVVEHAMKLDAIREVQGPADILKHGPIIARAHDVEMCGRKPIGDETERFDDIGHALAYVQSTDRRYARPGQIQGLRVDQSIQSVAADGTVDDGYGFPWIEAALDERAAFGAAHGHGDIAQFHELGMAVERVVDCGHEWDAGQPRREISYDGTGHHVRVNGIGLEAADRIDQLNLSGCSREWPPQAML